MFWLYFIYFVSYRQNPNILSKSKYGNQEFNIFFGNKQLQLDHLVMSVVSNLSVFEDRQGGRVDGSVRAMGKLVCVQMQLRTSTHGHQPLPQPGSEWLWPGNGPQPRDWEPLSSVFNKLHKNSKGYCIKFCSFFKTFFVLNQLHVAI